MKKIYASLLLALLLQVFFHSINAQCAGDRYHSLVFPGSPIVTSNITYGSNLDQYGVSQTLKLDVYEPACDTSNSRPLIVFAHGGSFVSGDKADASYVATATALAQLGYVVASINYRLGFPTSGIDALYGFNSAIVRGMHDGRAAVRFMRNNALNGGNTYGIDPNKIFFGGVSAGGIIALHLAYQNLQSEQTMNCNNQPGTEQSSIEGTTNTLAVSSSVTAIISISGGIRDLNWITTNDVPVCMAHGTVDGTVPYGSGQFGGYFQVYGSSSIAQRCVTTGTTYCFTPMINQDHVPSNPAYTDTIAVLMRNFLEHFACNTTLNCAYTGTPMPLSPSISIAITSGSNPSCTGQNVTFTATVNNGGTNISYQWKKNGSNVGTNSPTFSSTSLANGDVITCVLTTCASTSTQTSNAITMTVTSSSAPTVSIAVTSGSNPTCTGQSVTFTATPTNGGSAPTYQWKVNGNNVTGSGNTYTSSSLANGNVVSCVMTSNSSCANPTTATSNSVTMQVSSSVAPSVSIAITKGANPSCAGDTVTFTPTPTNGGSSPAYQWKKNGINTAVGASFTSVSLINSDVISCVLTSNLQCASPTTATSNTINMTINNVPTISQNGNVLTAGSSSSYQWYLNGVLIPGATNQTYTATASGTYTVKGVGNCESQPKTVTVTGIENVIEDFSFRIFPNPANKDFSVAVNENLISAVLNIYDEAGKKISSLKIESTETKLSTENFAEGIFLITISNGEKFYSERLVVRRTQ